MSARFLEDQQSPGPLFDRTTISEAPHLHYPGVGSYALDSLRIFCADDKDAWKSVMPQDKELVRYLVRLSYHRSYIPPNTNMAIHRQRWRWAAEEGKVWYPGGRGVIGDVDVPYLITLVDELAAHYDGAIGGEGYMYHFCNDLCAVLSGDVARHAVRVESR